MSTKALLFAIGRRPPGRTLLMMLATVFLLTGCADDSEVEVEVGFTLNAFTEELEVVEGSAVQSVNVSVERGTGSEPITLSLEADSLPNLNARLADTTLTGITQSTALEVELGVSRAPILPTTVQLTINATDGKFSDSATLTVNIQPTTAPDVYLLIGQSNMVGSSEDGDKQAGPGEPDAPNPRIQQLNVTPNDATIFNNLAAFSDPTRNVANPVIITAQDPLHETGNAAGDKPGTYIGLGMNFAKAALADTTANIVLVPAAWGGRGFCGVPTLAGAWNALATGNPRLGNTGLFDRAVVRTNLALEQTGGILRGILWHQGETDSNPRCAEFYENNIIALVSGLRSQINPDARGTSARADAADIPFVVGTMSRGKDPRRDLSVFDEDRLVVDGVHKNISSIVPLSATVNNDDLVPPAYPCGAVSCIHFGATAYREMGVRYYLALQDLVR